MKTNIITTVKATLLAVLCFSIAVTTASAGDPVPGVDVSIEQSPGGKIVGKGTTDANGVAKFDKIEPGTYIVTFRPRPPGRASNNYNSSKYNYRGIAAVTGAKIVSGSLTFSTDNPGKAKITVSGSGPLTIAAQTTSISNTKRPPSN